MSEEDIVRFCAPTLAGLKPGSLFAVPFSAKKEVTGEIRQLNRRLIAKGLRILPLSFRNNRVLLYSYRPGMVKASLKDESAAALLEQRGYPPENLPHCLRTLMRRLRGPSEFPHEIGLFLGYPPEDVKGFIDQQALNSKCTGCWKVYGDRQKAEQIFSLYEKCTACYLRNWRRGVSLERLTVGL